jgi:septal ring factor EnvC (AmiA/AmiB activator)
MVPLKDLRHPINDKFVMRCPGEHAAAPSNPTASFESRSRHFLWCFFCSSNISIMEAFSVAASIIAVVEVGVEISTELSRLARKMKKAGKEVAEIADEISSLSSTLENLRLCLEEEMQRGEPVHTERMIDDIKVLLKRIKDLHTETWKLIPRNFKDAEDNKGKLNLAERFMWVFRSPKANAIMKKMDSLKSTLTVMLVTLQVALQQKLIS